MIAVRMHLKRGCRDGLLGILHECNITLDPQQIGVLRLLVLAGTVKIRLGTALVLTSNLWYISSSLWPSTVEDVLLVMCEADNVKRASMLPHIVQSQDSV